MKVGFRQLCLLSLKNVSSFSVLGVLLGRFSSVLQCIWISEIPARAGALQLWREPSREVTCLAARSSKNNLSNSTQEAKKGRGKKHLGLCKSKGETQVESLRMSWEGWPPEEGEDWEGNGKAELLMWSWENTGRRTHGMWGGPCRGGVHIATVSHTALKPENQDAGKGWRCPSQRTAVVTLILPETCWSFGEGCAQKYQQLILHFSR